MKVIITDTSYELKYSIWYKIKLLAIFIICGALINLSVWPALTGEYFINFYVSLAIEIIGSLSCMIALLFIVGQLGLAVNRHFLLSEGSFTSLYKGKFKTKQISVPVSDLKSASIFNGKDVIRNYYLVKLNFIDGRQWELKIFRKLSDAEQLKNWLDRTIFKI